MCYNTDFLNWHKIPVIAGSQSEMMCFSPTSSIFPDIWLFFILFSLPEAPVLTILHTDKISIFNVHINAILSLVFFIPFSLNDFFQNLLIFLQWKIHLRLTLQDHMLHICDGPGITVTSPVPCSSDGIGSACSAGDPGLIPGSGKCPREENGNPFQYSCLENYINKWSWWATVHGITKSPARLKQLNHLHALKSARVIIGTKQIWWRWNSKQMNEWMNEWITKQKSLENHSLVKNKQTNNNKEKNCLKSS